jgi:anti-sigma B factor antagonist
MPLNVEVERLSAQSAAVLLTGTLTLGTNLKTAEANVLQLIENGANRLVFDLSGCSYADSAGLGFLVHISGLVAANGGTLRLCGVKARIAELLHMTRTETLLTVDPDRETSLRCLSGIQ